MNILKSKFWLSFITILFISSGCTNKPNIISPPKKTNDPARQFIDIHDLGRKITLHSEFNEFLGHIPDGKWKSRVYLARIDGIVAGYGVNNISEISKGINKLLLSKS